MNLTSLIANRDAYRDLFAEGGYARDGGFDVLSLDRHCVGVFGDLGCKFFGTVSYSS